MQIQLESQPYSSLASGALVTYIFDKDSKFEGVAGEIDRAMNGRLSSLAASGELTGKALELVLIHFPQGLAAERLLLVGAGKPEKFSTSDLRKIAGTALRYLKSRGVKNFAFLAREGDAWCGSRAQASPKDWSSPISNPINTAAKRKIAKSLPFRWRVSMRGLGSSLQEAIDHGRIIAESQNFARDLINEPSNHLTPRMLAAHAEAMANEVGLGVEILDERRIAELKMGALLGVAQGSVEPPRDDRPPLHARDGDRGRPGPRSRRQSRHVRYRRHFHQARRQHGKNEVRHGRRRHHARRHARARAI